MTAPVVWAGTTSYRDQIGNIRSRSAERYAFDAHTGEAINCCGGFEETTDGEREEVKRSGQISKYPFGTEKEDYKFWDATLGQAVTTKFVKEDEIEGLKVYEFKYEVPDHRRHPGDPAVHGRRDRQPVRSRSTSSTRTVTQHWVEPVTGVVIDRVSDTGQHAGARRRGP